MTYFRWEKDYSLSHILQTRTIHTLSVPKNIQKAKTLVRFIYMSCFASPPDSVLETLELPTSTDSTAMSNQQEVQQPSTSTCTNTRRVESVAGQMDKSSVPSTKKTSRKKKQMNGKSSDMEVDQEPSSSKESKTSTTVSTSPTLPASLQRQNATFLLCPFHQVDTETPSSITSQRVSRIGSGRTW